MDASRAAQAAQLGAIGQLTGVDASALTAVLPIVEELCAQPLVIELRGDGKGLGVVIPLPATDVTGVIERLDDAIGGLARPLTRAIAGSESATRELELRTQPDGLTTAVRVIGPRSREDEVAALAALGVHEPARTPLFALIDDVPHTRSGLVVRISARTSDPDVEVGRVVPPSADAIAILDRLTGAAGVTAPQRGLIAQIHPLLAAGHGALVAIAVTPRGLASRLSIRYAPMAWDHGLRFVTGLYRGDAATRLGTFAGATGGQRVEGLEVILGPEEPPLSWVATAQRAPAPSLA